MWLVSDMMREISAFDSGRLKSLFGVALVHALLGAVLILGLRAEVTPPSSEPLKLVDLIEQAPPPPIVEPPPVQPRKAASEAAPSAPSFKTEASPMVVPPPQVRLEVKPVVIVVPVAGVGTSVPAGTGESAGTGTGAGGRGSGSGAGGEGAGGSGEADGPAVRTRRIEGSFTSRDYPREAYRAGMEGITVARLKIGADGRVSECIVRASSGSEVLDRATCGIIHNRFRFEPARTSRGEPTTDTVEWEQNWSLRREGPEAAEAQCRAEADKIKERRAARAEFFSCMAALGWSRR